MGYFFKELLDLFKWMCCGFTFAYCLASYHGLDTSFSSLWGWSWHIILVVTNVILNKLLIM